MVAKILRVGLIGANVNYGWGSRAHVPALQHLPEFELTAVCTRSPETAKETALRYDIPLAFSKPWDLASCEDVDIVVVSTRAPTHHKLAKLAIEAGKHILCEWPLGTSFEQSTELLRLAEAKNIRHMVCLQGRGSPVFNYVKSLISDGYIGQVISATLITSLPGAGTRVPTFTEGVAKESGVGTLRIGAGHTLDSLCFCLGEFQEISALVRTQTKKALVVETGAMLEVTTPDNVALSGVLKNGAVINAHIKSVPSHGTGFLLEIDGDEGSLIVQADGYGHMNDATVRGGRRSDRVIGNLAIPDEYSWVPKDMPPGPAFNVAQIYRKFGERILDGGPVDPDFNVAITRHQMIEAIQKASDAGQKQTP